MEEQVSEEDGGNDAGKVCQQTAREGIAGILDVHATEIHGDDIERGIG